MQQLNRHIQQILNSKEMLDLLATVTNVPKNEFSNEYAHALINQSSAAILEAKSASTFEKNALLLEQLNYRNGIHYSVPRNIT